MAKIDQLSKNGQAIYPVTHESAVLDSNGVSIDRKMNEANDKINGKAEQQYVDEELGKVNSQLENIVTDKLDGHGFKWVTKEVYTEMEQAGTLDPLIEYHITDSNEPSVAEITETDKGKILAAKQDGTGTEWIEKPAGGGSSDLSSYQQKEDDTLTTTAKTVVGAINENKDKIDILNINIPNTYATKEELNELALGNGSLTLRGIIEGEVFTVNEGTIPVYGQIVLNKTSISITEGSSGTFTVALDKAPTNNQIVTLSKTNVDVSLSATSLTFTPSNFATPQTVTINVSEDNSDYNNETDTITLTSPNVTTKTVSVAITDNDTAPSNIPVTGVTVSPTTATINTIGGFQQLSATIAPTEATNKAVNWGSSNTAVAEVDNTGKVTSRAEGSTTITCTSVSDETKKATCSITVTVAPLDYISTGLDFDFRAKDFSGSTTSIKDRTNKYTGTLTNFKFDGTDGWINGGLKVTIPSTGYNYTTLTFPNVSSLTIPCTIETVFNPNGDTTNNKYFAFGGSGMYDFLLSLESAIKIQKKNSSGTTAESSTNITLNSNAKNHVIISIESSGVIKYAINGVYNTITLSDFSAYIPITSTNLALGRSQRGITNATYYDVRVYNRNLSQAEMTNNYNAYLGGV